METEQQPDEARIDDPSEETGGGEGGGADIGEPRTDEPSEPTEGGAGEAEAPTGP